MQFRLPYFDMILSRLESGDPEYEMAFERHVHFGWWDDPGNAYTDLEDSLKAPDRLCERLLKLARIRDGQDVLDVGCGFGGTLAALNEQFSEMRLTGLNIDERQIERARRHVIPRPGNTLDWVVQDACAMNFADESFDRILAVECIFHFPSRQKFFKHVSRMLRPGGNLTLTDFLQPSDTPIGQFDTPDQSFWGRYSAIDITRYQDLAEQYGLVLTHAEDITVQVRPSYHFFGELLGKHFPESRLAHENSALLLDVGALGYCTLRFERPALSTMSIHLPYFDVILSRLEDEDPAFQQAFGRHVHFGVWDGEASLEPEDTARAMERLTEKLIEMADIRDGQEVLDAGCGFGGTLASLDERFSDMRLTGINIDGRQLEVARRRARTRPGNRLEFVLGDACQLPFADASFDRVLAVECIFHFPSRKAFFEHVRRVLRPGGNLTISDFLPESRRSTPETDESEDRLWGNRSAISLEAYRELAAEVGMELTQAEDISSSVLPSYTFYGKLLGKYIEGAEIHTEIARSFMDAGMFRYYNLRFDLIK